MSTFKSPAGPWNGWYHIMCHTYGTWLPGDPKGFRTRHHREHVDGDYKNPPPDGKYEKRWQRSKELMKREPVYLEMDQRQRAVKEFVRSFEKWGIELRIISIDRIHVHLLARVLDRNPRHYMGLAKKECSAYMKRDGLAPTGGLWAVRCECVPIADAQHFQNVAEYIHDHEQAGGVVWESTSAPARESAPASTMVDFDPSSLLLD
jgi:hypothetical protein